MRNDESHERNTSSFNGRWIPHMRWSSRQQRWSATVMIAFLLVLFFVFNLASIRFAWSVETATKDEPYEWQEWNYYQILGLPDPATTAFETDEAFARAVRKAYREQSKRWHPDKQLLHNQTRDGHPAVSADEAQARFVRISEAYQVLSDETHRRQYNDYLQYLDRQKQYSATPRDDWGSAQQQDIYSALFAAQQQWMQWNQFDHLWQDPWSLFEDIFAATSGQTTGASFTTPDDSFASNEPPHTAGSQGRYSQQPINVYEEEVLGWDAMSGQEILRVVRTEEYLAADSSSPSQALYYRVLVSDYVEDWDPAQRRWVYRALQASPVLTDEGYRELRPSDSFYWNNQPHYSSPTAPHESDDRAYNSKRETLDSLGEDEMLTTHDRLRQGPYILGISEADVAPRGLSCELWIVDSSWPLTDSDDDDDTFEDYYWSLMNKGRQKEAASDERNRYHLIWSSADGAAKESWWPPRLSRSNIQGTACRLELSRGHLVLSASPPSMRPSNDKAEWSVVWSSDSIGNEDASAASIGHSSSLVSRLDTDGSFTLYRVYQRSALRDEYQWLSWSPSEEARDQSVSSRDQANLSNMLWQWGRLIPRNLSRFIRCFWVFAVQGWRLVETNSEQSKVLAERRRCVWTSNPFGCNRFLRLLLQVLRPARKRCSQVLSRADELFNALL
jgi:curved DNA-binding protein CbpA